MCFSGPFHQTFNSIVKGYISREQFFFFFKKKSIFFPCKTGISNQNKHLDFKDPTLTPRVWHGMNTIFGGRNIYILCKQKRV